MANSIIKIEFPEELMAKMDRLIELLEAAAPAAAEPAKPAKKTRKKAAAEPQHEQEAEPATQAETDLPGVNPPEDLPWEEPKQEEPPVDFAALRDEIRAVGITLVWSGKRDGCRAVLEAFGVSAAPDLKDDQLAACLQQLRALEAD